MSAGMIGYVGRLRAALGPEAADAELLRAYAASRDADAFAALVHRHGPRVWAVCRRVVGDPHVAEDAFQAVFLVLARKAGGLPASHPLGGWLHVVAVNVSRRARTATDRRKRREVGAVDAVAPTPPEPPDERALAALDEELARLPAKLRDAVVLCELDGLSRKEAAARLGVPEGTLSSRLAAARKRLADRLRGRGVGPELLAVSAAVPAGLAEAASGLGVGAVPAPAVAALAGGTMRALLLKGLAAGAVACGLLAVGGYAKDEPPASPAASRPAEAAPVAPAQAKPADPEPAVPRGLLLRTARRHLLLDPADGGTRDFPGVGAFPVWSPDGRWLADTENRDRTGRFPHSQMVLRRTDGSGEFVRVDLPADLVSRPTVGEFTALRWQSDGTLLVVRHSPKPTDPAAVARFDPAARTFTTLPADTPTGARSPDGKWVCVPVPAEAVRDGAPVPSVRLGLRPPANGEPVLVTPADRDALGGEFSPDSTRLLYLDRKPGGAVYPYTQRVCVLDLATKTVTVLAEATRDLELGEKVGEGGVLNPGAPRPVRVYSVPPGSDDADRVYRSMTVVGEEFRGMAWSPDGRRVAFARGQSRDGVSLGSKVLKSEVVVCDADGKNPRRLWNCEGDWGQLSGWR